MTSPNTTLALAMRDEPQAVMLTNAQLNVIANTEFVPKSMRGNVPKVLACVARGRAMGIPDAVALGGIDIIEGKATISAELMCAIVRLHGHSITGSVDANGAKVTGKRRDNGDTMTGEFNREMAEAAGLLGKANWKKHPDDMMWARAVSKLCRRLFADCFAGGTYAPEDMQPTADETLDGDWEAADAGGLTEPVAESVARGGSSGVSAPTGERLGSREPVPGSVSPWAAVVETFGEDRVRAKKVELFGDTAWKAITQIGIEEIVDALKAEKAAIA